MTLSCNNEDGFILVWALLLLVVVTLLGAAGISTSIFEERMAANEALHQQTFLEADGGTENALALIKENLNCIYGFTDSDINTVVEVAPDKLNFWLSNDQVSEIDPPTDQLRDFHYPVGYGDGPHTNGRINRTTKLNTGANLPMQAGYEGLGKALGEGGAYMEFDIKIERVGARNSRSLLHTKFRLPNQFLESEACIY